MIIFNTIKAAEHYVKFCQKFKDYSYGGYDWRSQMTYIRDNLVIVNNSGDTCGCGCDSYRYDNYYIIGRIKSHNTKTIRDNKIKSILK